MNIWVSQIYVTPGVRFPFSWRMQVRLSDKLTSLVGPSPEFQARYGGGYEVGVNLSAKTGIDANVIAGPTVFKKTKSVEYTLFLPFDRIMGPGEFRVSGEYT